MLKFNLPDGSQFQVEREGLEERALEAVLARFEEAKEKDPGMYTALKSAVQMMVTLAGNKLDIKIPKGENVLEYIVATYLSRSLDALEAREIPVVGKLVQENGKDR